MRDARLREPLEGRTSLGQGRLPLGRVAHRAEVKRGLRRRDTLFERELPPADVMPGPQLIAHGTIDPDRLKPEGFMEPDTCRIRQRDTGVSLIEALQG
jgi:hypothetical protein